ncbi:hypothetical protein [Vibrio sp. SCSIO 43136]|uniref:hypothetical protein n=1 Tax=Vibrio sp. SCSIO 43136 TaxID=2819101 RepID=UPI00207540A0|nr:hypothetical protein [Vibrio sp. SCSIO 43136]USD66462.1 hypothetical protein J4N39_06545 [Vibrio sp. SCSIO 43136]
MKKLLLATALVTVSGIASANVDFTVLGGFESSDGLNLGAEVGFGAAVIGYKGLGGSESMSANQMVTFTESTGHDTIYGGFRLGNGMTVKAGAMITSLEKSAEALGQKESKSGSVIRPMIGFGFDVNPNVVVDLHYTMSGEIQADTELHTYDDSIGLLAGYRF